MSLVIHIHVGEFSIHLYCKHVEKEETVIFFLPLSHIVWGSIVRTKYAGGKSG